MAAAFVQGNSNIAFTSLTVTVTLTGVAAANLIAVAFFWANTTVTLDSVTDDQGNSYTILDNPTTNTDGGFRSAHAYAPNVAAGTTIITATFSSTAGGKAIWAHEVSGLDTVDPLDVRSVFANPAFRDTTCTDCVVSGSATTTQDGEYIFGWTNSGQSPGMDAGTGYTERIRGASNRGITEDKVQASAGSVEVTFSRNDITGGRHTTGMLCFKVPGLAEIPAARPAWNYRLHA